MKVLFNCPMPFALAHGGMQIQIEQTQAALEKLGVAVEPLRWWDASQTGDVLQQFGRTPAAPVRLAQQKGMKVVLLDLLTEQGSRSPARLKLQCLIRRALTLGMTRRRIEEVFHWGAFRLADACVALTDWEARLMIMLYGAPPDKIHVVPNGVEEVFFQSQPSKRGPWLVCTATVTERKRVLELAEAAVCARTPTWIVGKPYTESEPYVQRFIALAKSHPETVRYEGPVPDRAKLAKIYREARGFVLLSAVESLSLSALEAAACDCPLLLSRLPWATTVFREAAAYCPVAAPSRMAPFLRQFYDAAPGLKPPPRPPTWLEVGQQLKQLYEGLLRTP